MIKRAKRLHAVRGFGIDQVAAAAALRGRARSDWPVLRMENLDTDLPLPPGVLEATVAGLKTREANSWLPFTGDLSLREAIAAHTAARTGHRYDPESEIVITCGGMEGLLDVLLATVDPGDEVILTDPTYAGLVNRVHLVGGVPRLVPFRVVDGEWRLGLEALAGAVAGRTAALVLMSPSMPSGAVLTRGEWQAVCDLCRERSLFLVYDAAMERLLFDGRPLVHPLHFEGMLERTVIVGSMSKEHRMIGWRVGWVAGPRVLIGDVAWTHVYNTTTPVGIARAAATAALRGDQESVADAVAELERRRDAIFEALPGWPLVRPAGGWSMLLDAVALGFSAAEASRLLLEEAAVAATAMTGWGGPVAERYLRLVFSAEPVERLRTLPERVRGGRLAAAAAEASRG